MWSCEACSAETCIWLRASDCFTVSIWASVILPASRVEPRVAPRIMLVKPSSFAKRTLASVNGARMPSRGFHSAALGELVKLCGRGDAAEKSTSGQECLLVAEELTAPELSYTNRKSLGLGGTLPRGPPITK